MARRTEVPEEPRPKIVFGVHEICRYCRGTVSGKGKKRKVGCAQCKYTGFVEIRGGTSGKG